MEEICQQAWNPSRGGLFYDGVAHGNSETTVARVPSQLSGVVIGSGTPSPKAGGCKLPPPPPDSTENWRE